MRAKRVNCCRSTLAKSFALVATAVVVYLVSCAYSGRLRGRLWKDPLREKQGLESNRGDKSER